MEQDTSRWRDLEAFKHFRVQERQRDHLFELLDMRSEASDRVERDVGRDAQRIGVRESCGPSSADEHDDTVGGGIRSNQTRTCSAVDLAKIRRCTVSKVETASGEHAATGEGSPRTRKQCCLARAGHVGSIVVRLVG